MFWNQIIGLSKFTGLFNAIKDLANSLSNNPHKHPLTYVFIVTIGAVFLSPNNLDFRYFTCYKTLIFLFSTIFFYSCFYSFYPWIKTMIKNFFVQKKAIEYFYELTNEQKYYLLEFFPNTNVTRLKCVHRDDFSLRELIEYKILFSDVNNLYYDEDIEHHFTNLKVAKYILKIIRKNNLLESWKAEKKANDIKIKESESESIPF